MKLLSSGGAAVFKAAIVEACQELINNTAFLNELDSEVGDGDCGSTLANGARCMSHCQCHQVPNTDCYWPIYQHRDVTKLAFEFHNVRTSNIFSIFEIRRIFSRTRHRIRTSRLHDWHHMSTPTGHRNNQLNKCELSNSLK